MSNLREIAKKINISGEVRISEKMDRHTTYKTGGPADLFTQPQDLRDLKILFRVAEEERLPVFIMGGGANILVADRGIRGLVISTSKMKRFTLQRNSFTAYSGISMSTASWETGASGLSGIETFYAMPGTLGGAIWMNARCYGRSICESLVGVTLLKPDGGLNKETIRKQDFTYKKSPFQNENSLIVEAEFILEYDDSRDLCRKMKEYEVDRITKGHFRSPSAGSVFKNNRDFGKPSGQIVDEAGLRGLSVGGASVSPDHGNIIFNTGDASSLDIKTLICRIKKEVEKKTGFLLEEEILYTGEW